MSSDLSTTLNPVANSIRGLAMDGVQQANSGHPGMPLGMADVASLLWARYLKFDPQRPSWPDRDRFVLSAGHGSMLLYALLHLSGYDLPLEQLKQFRQWGSQTPGHPERHDTPGVEMTTGPLGQGISSAVGIALAERWLAARFNRPDFNLVDHHTYVIAGDGDLMEGISGEASSLAGHWGLGKLIVFYDDNHISIDGSTSISFTEDVAMRYTAYGWGTWHVDGHNPDAVAAALEEALADGERPSLIACRTIIGFGSPNRQGTAKAHGEPLGAEEVRLTKEALGLPQEAFWADPAAYQILGAAGKAGADEHTLWHDLLEQYTAVYPQEAAEFKRTMHGELPPGWDDFSVEYTAPDATRNTAHKALNVLAQRVPELLGGSADLTGSNLTNTTSTPNLRFAALSGEGNGGRHINYGVREFGMAAVMNGLALHGGYIPYGGTFLTFSDYSRNAIRMAALMKLRVIHVFTHDSIGLGEDGPTHQSIEHAASLRLIPNLDVWRPADTAETAVAWAVALQNKNKPTALLLSRQNLAYAPKTDLGEISRGAYILAEPARVGLKKKAQAVIIATGSEVQLALQAQALLAERKIAVRVVSMPSTTAFDRQTPEYKAEVLPKGLPRIAVEMGVTDGWWKYGCAAVVGIDTFGESAPAPVLFKHFGFTPENVADTVQAALTRK